MSAGRGRVNTGRGRNPVKPTFRSKGRKKAMPAAGPVTIVNTQTGEVREEPAKPVTARRDRPTGGRMF